MDNLKIGFIGLGLIGGSIARSIKKFYPNYILGAYSRTRSACEMAKSDKVIDIICTSEDPFFGTCDFIFLCAPVQTNIAYLTFMKKIMKPDCILTDVGSVKGDIHEAVRQCDLEDHFIGGHPMAGTEKTGYANSTDYMVENAYYFITPSSKTGDEQVRRYAELLSAIGSVPLIMTPEEHDFIVAGISHLPQLVASSLVNTVAGIDTENEEMKLVAAGGFKDITRIASSSAVMWQHICQTNRKKILQVLDRFSLELKHVRSLVDTQDSEGLIRMFQSAKDYRDSLIDNKYSPTMKQYVLYCDIYDQPGGIAAITTALYEGHINIKNIGILHNREFEEGVIRLEFYDDKAFSLAYQYLTKHGFVVRKRS